MPRSAITNINQQLQQLGQTKWGFVIYRCTYDNQADWEEFMKTFRVHVTDSFEDEGAEGQALLSQLEWTIIEDRERLENASKATVRSMFQQWVESVSPESEGSKPAFSHLSKTPSPRYAYCIQVNQDSLRSVLAESSGEDVEAYVYLIKRRFPARDFLPQHMREAMENDEAEMDESDDGPQEDDNEDGEEEDYGTDDVDGFMKLDPSCAYPGAYDYVLDSSDWHLLYVRPPAIGPM